MGIGVPVVRVVVVLGRGKWDVGLVVHQVDSVGARGRRRVKVDPVPGQGARQGCRPAHHKRRRLGALIPHYRLHRPGRAA